MWRPETKAEKNAREHPASNVAPVQAAPAINPDDARQALQGSCWGSFFLIVLTVVLKELNMQCM